MQFSVPVVSDEAAEVAVCMMGVACLAQDLNKESKRIARYRARMESVDKWMSRRHLPKSHASGAGASNAACMIWAGGGCSRDARDERRGLPGAGPEQGVQADRAVPRPHGVRGQVDEPAPPAQEPALPHRAPLSGGKAEPDTLLKSVVLTTDLKS